MRVLNTIKTLNTHKNPKAALTIALVLLLTLSTFAVALPTTSAHTPAWTIPTYPYLVISPNPIGVGQMVYVVMWLHGAPPTASGNAGDRWHDFFLDVTKPDGTTETRGPFISDPTGSTYDIFTPTMTGQYTFKLRYTGQVLTMVNPANGLAASKTDATLTRFGGVLFENDTFLPSETSLTLTVQQTPIAKIPNAPLPTTYWTHPIEGQNAAWSGITSNWLQGAYLGYEIGAPSAVANLWQRTGEAPDSGHILWTKPIEFGGIVGGTGSPTAFYSGGSYEGRFTGSMIMNGMLFYQEPLGHSNTGGGYTAVDLRTGQTIWHRDDIGMTTTGGTVGTNATTSTMAVAAPSFGQLYQYESPNQHGVVGGLLWQASTAAGKTTWQGFDAFTGKWVFNETGVPGGFEVYTDDGEIVRYVLAYNTTTKAGSIKLWNNTCEQQGLHLAKGYITDAWQWRPNGKVVDMSQAYSWTVPINFDITGDTAPAIQYVIPGDIIIGTSSSLAWLGGIILKTPNPIVVWAISDKPGNRGELLWRQEIPAPANFITPFWGPIDAQSRIWTLNYIETFEWVGYSVDTGQQVWGPVSSAQNDFTYYGSGKGGGQVGYIAYGNLYTQGFGGEIMCYDMATGATEWRYDNTNSGDETVWGNYPIFILAIADGKVYAFNNEHSPNYPLYKGEKVYCIDAYTGNEIWTMMSWAGQAGGPGTSTGILADGVLVYYNYYDNQIYAVGKGPSETWVDNWEDTVTAGESVVIKGGIYDISAGAKDLIESGKFNVVPAMSDASQSKWMEYLYMQKPMPEDATGVQVKLTAYDEDNNAFAIGTATSCELGNFATTWTPPEAGFYNIVAEFEGSNSYWPSSAETFINVVAAPVEEPKETTASLEIYILAAIVLVIILMLVAILLMLRKK